MPEENQAYRGKEIVIHTEGNGPKVTIGGKEVEVSLEEDSGRYETLRLPYASFDSLEDLAKRVIDNDPDFSGETANE